MRLFHILTQDAYHLLLIQMQFIHLTRVRRYHIGLLKSALGSLHSWIPARQRKQVPRPELHHQFYVQSVQSIKIMILIICLVAKWGIEVALVQTENIVEDMGNLVQKAHIHPVVLAGKTLKLVITASVIWAVPSLPASLLLPLNSGLQMQIISIQCIKYQLINLQVHQEETKLQLWGLPHYYQRGESTQFLQQTQGHPYIGMTMLGVLYLHRPRMSVLPRRCLQGQSLHTHVSLYSIVVPS